MKTSQIVLASLSVLGAAGVGYAIYFDYRRRNDIEFRKSLKRASKRTSKVNKKEAEKAAKAEAETIERVLNEIRAPNGLPTSVEEKEQYFLQHVSLGEQLFARGPEHHLDASIEFFKALKVYPSPVELIMIYQKAVPKEVFDCIMRIVSKDIALGGGDAATGLAAQTTQNLDDVDEDGPGTGAAADAIPADDAAAAATAETSEEASSAAPAAAAPQNGTDSGTTSSQEWDRLSATSLEPSSTSASAPAPAAEEEAAAAAEETAAEKESTLAADSTTSTSAPAPPSPSANFSSGWSPAPVFGEAKSPSTETPAESKSEN